MNIYSDFPNWVQYSISNYPGSGYLAKLTLSWKPGMKMDFSDIRFHDKNKSILQYHIPSYTVGQTATIWVKLASSNIVFLRYGNGAAKSESNKNIYVLYEDFESPLSGWSTGGSSTFTRSTAKVKSGTYSGFYNSSTSYENIYKDFPSRATCTVEFDWLIPVNTPNSSYFFVEGSAHSYLNGVILYSSNYDLDYYSGGTVKLSTISVDTWCHIKLNVYAATNKFDIQIDNNTPVTNITLRGNLSAGITNVGVMSQSCTEYVDNIVVRPYVAIEPTFVYTSSGYNFNQIYFSAIAQDMTYLNKYLAHSNSCNIYGNVAVDNNISVNKYINNQSNLPVSAVNKSTNNILYSKSIVSFSNLDEFYLCHNIDDMYFSTNKGYINDININNQYITHSDLPLLMLLFELNDMYYLIPSFNIYNDINENSNHRNINDLSITKSVKSKNDIRLSSILQDITYINLDKHILETDDIFKFLKISGLNSNDIYTHNFIINSNDTSIVKMFNDFSNIFIIGGLGNVVNPSDISLDIDYSSKNNLLIYGKTVNSNDLEIIIRKYFDSVNNIIVDVNANNISEIIYFNNLMSLNDINLFEFINSIADLGSMNFNVVYNLNKIDINNKFNSDSDIYTNRNIFTENNVLLVKKFVDTSTLINLLRKYLVTTSKIKLNKLLVDESFFPAVIGIKNANNIEGKIRGNYKSYVNIKIPMPFIEEKVYEKGDTLPLYPYSTYFFTFDDEGNTCIFNNTTNNLFNNIPNCKGVGWFTETGLEFFVFNKTMNLVDLYMYEFIYYYILLDLKPNTRVYHGHVFYANKSTDLDNGMYKVVEDILLLVKRLGSDDIV